MSFDNSNYPNRKDNRKLWKGRDSRIFDRSCRSHGSCAWCQESKKYRYRKREPIVTENDLEEYTPQIKRLLNSID